MRILILIFFILLNISTLNFAKAEDEYGTSCDYNDDCVDCKEDVNCLECLNYCYNQFGNPEGRYHKCQPAAKRCSAKCWTRDDEEKLPSNTDNCRKLGDYSIYD